MDQKDSTRQTVRCLPISPGKFAVFRRKKGQAHFVVLHDTYELASSEAVRLLLKRRTEGKTGDAFIVVRLCAYFTFDESGKPEFNELETAAL